MNGNRMGLWEGSFTLGRVSADGTHGTFVDVPAGSMANGLRFDRQGQLFVADLTGHNVLRLDPISKAISVFAHEPRMNQPNDLAITDADVLFASDPNWSEGTGQLWRIDPDGTVHLDGNGDGHDQWHRGRSWRHALCGRERAALDLAV
ncbi:MAG: hypothetical protein VYB08_10700 [Candidatus Latescibacterota bacterium]|nr:hypothetical protein [Candidatus Latescibacterota bacterium]